MRFQTAHPPQSLRRTRSFRADARIVPLDLSSAAVLKKEKQITIGEEREKKNFRPRARARKVQKKESRKIVDLVNIHSANIFSRSTCTSVVSSTLPMAWRLDIGKRNNFHHTTPGRWRDLWFWRPRALVTLGWKLSSFVCYLPGKWRESIRRKTGRSPGCSTECWCWIACSGCCCGWARCGAWPRGGRPSRRLHPRRPEWSAEDSESSDWDCWVASAAAPLPRKWCP